MDRRGAARPRTTPPDPAGPVGEGGFFSLTPERARVLLLVAARPATFALTLAAVLVLVTLLAAGSGTEGAAGAIAVSWLGMHQVPLVVGKTTLGVLPLLATALLVWGVARECAHAVEPGASRVDIYWILGAALTGPLLVTSVCTAVAEDASAVVALQPPDPLVAFGWVLLWHLLAAAIGIGSRASTVGFAMPRPPEWVLAGAATGLVIALRMLGCAAAVVLVALVANWSGFTVGYANAGGAVGVLGLTLLSIGYLPNVVVAAVGVLLGPGAQLGGAEIGLFGVIGGPVPALPVLAAIPSGPAAGWWPVLLLVPAVVGTLGGLDAARRSDDRLRAPWATLTAAGTGTLMLLLLGVVGGGQAGEFGRFGMLLPAFAVVAFAWFAIFGYAGLVFGRRWALDLRLPRRRVPRDTAAGTAVLPATPDARFDPDGYDPDGYDPEGFDRQGYDRDGFDRDGYDGYGYDEAGFDDEGYDEDGFDRHGFDDEGYDAEGYHRDEYEDVPDDEPAEHAADDDPDADDRPAFRVRTRDSGDADAAAAEDEHPGARYLDPEPAEPLVAELMDDPDAVVAARNPPAVGGTQEIVDAEVVDGDLPDGGRTRGR